MHCPPGLCSLAELEAFVLKALLQKYPKTGKGKDMKTPGQDIFKEFRPCYVRAFSDAKDYKADTGEVLDGLATATQDDYVSWEEFRLFCCYLIIYGAMFDAFAKVDGGGSGRGASDNKRIELDEWMAGWKGVRGHGFVALAAVTTTEEAAEVFSKMDDNGGGVVLLDEWCYFLKSAEVAANTSVGILLAMEEPEAAGEDETGHLPKKPKSKFLELPLPPPPEVTPNPFGLAVGKSASKDYFDFAACFEPMCAETPEGDALRVEGFKAADPNGNGMCRSSNY